MRVALLLLMMTASAYADPPAVPPGHVKIDTRIDGAESLGDIQWFLKNHSLPNASNIEFITDEQVNVQACTPGTYSNDNQTRCTPCPAGTFTGATAASSLLFCEPCHPGTWSPEGSANCTLCAANTFNENFGSSAITACEACPAHTASLPGSGSVYACQCVASYFESPPVLDAWGEVVQSYNWNFQLSVLLQPVGPWTEVGTVRKEIAGIATSPDNIPQTYWNPGMQVLGLDSGEKISRELPTVAGRSYSIRVKYTGTGNFKVTWNTDVIYTQQASGDWVFASTVFVTANGTDTIKFATAGGYVWLGEVELLDTGRWAYADVAAVHVLNGMSVLEQVGQYTHNTTIFPAAIQATAALQNATVLVGQNYTLSYYAGGSGSLTVEINGATIASHPLGGFGTYSVQVGPFASPNLLVVFTTSGDAALGPPELKLTGNDLCFACLEDYWCNGNTINFCPLNTLSHTGAQAQSGCYCQPGYYSLVGDSPCTICPMNHYCEGGQAKSFCPPGTQSELGSTLAQCTTCPPGVVCFGGTVGTCPAFSNSSAGADSVSQDCACNPGYYGPPESCQICEPGFYCPGGANKIACTDHATSATGSIAASQCFCDRGYIGLNNNPCTVCPEGSWCWTGIQNTCPDNMWSPQLSSYQINCTCEKGYTGQNGGPCTECGVGHYKDVRGPSQCTPCGVGTHSNAIAAISVSTCVHCGAGYYNPFTGQEDCTACAAGSSQWQVGSTNCTTCVAGTWAAAAAATCTSCLAGTASSAVGAVSIDTCVSCGGGQYAVVASTTCTDCGYCSAWSWPLSNHLYPGTLTKVADIGSGIYLNSGMLAAYVSSTRVAVTNTNNGVYWFNPTTNAVTHSGIYGPTPALMWGMTADAESVFIIQNMVHEYDANSGSLIRSYTSLSAKGVAVNGNTVWVAQSESLRSYNRGDGSQLASYSLPSGISTASYKICITPTGKIFGIGVYPFGFRSFVNGAWSDRISTTMGTASCTASTDGSVLIITSPSGAWAYNVESGAIYVLDEGNDAYYGGVAIQQGLNWNVVVTGAGGVYKETMAGVHASTCGPGLFSDQPSLPSESQCTVCPAGSVCGGGTSIGLCAPGTYSTVTGLRAQGQCKVCDAGYYCPGGDMVEMCPIGSYSIATGLSFTGECGACPANSYCPNTTTVKTCPTHTHSAARSHDLADCICNAGFQCQLVKVVHAQVTLPITADEFTPELQQRYIAAVAASAGVSPEQVQIISIFNGGVGGGGNRRLLSSKTLEVHLNIYGADHHTALDKLDHQLSARGLARPVARHVVLHKEVVKAHKIEDKKAHKIEDKKAQKAVRV